MKTITTKILSIILTLTLLLPTFACSTDQVLSDIDLVLQTGNVLCTTLGTVLPTDQAACQVISGIGINGIEAIKKDYDDFKSTSNATDLLKIASVADTIKKNLATELAAAHIQDAKTVERVTAWVNFIDTMVDTIVNLVGEVNGQPVNAYAMINVRAKVVKGPVVGLPTPESLQDRWSQEVCKGDVACSNAVTVHHISNSKAGRFGQKVVHVLTFGAK